MSRTLFKVFRLGEWLDFEQSGRFDGSPDDLRDGFIHLSYAGQVTGTLDRHFAGENSLVLAAFDRATLGAALREEVSRGGALFPHLYGALTSGALRQVIRLARGPNGFDLPSGFGGEES
jgi:uncharacterized protein (DUF952 family)